MSKRWQLVPHNISELLNMKLPIKFTIMIDNLNRYLEQHRFNKVLENSVYKIIQAHNNKQNIPNCEITFKDEG